MDPLLGLLADDDARVRAVAAGVLGSACTFGDRRWGPAPLPAQLVQATANPDSEVRIAAIEALGAHARTEVARSTFLRLIATLGRQQRDLGPWIALLHAIIRWRQDPPHAEAFIEAITAHAGKLPLRGAVRSTLVMLERYRRDVTP